MIFNVGEIKTLIIISKAEAATRGQIIINFPASNLDAIITTLVDCKMITKSIDEYPFHCLTDKGKQYLNTYNNIGVPDVFNKDHYDRAVMEFLYFAKEPIEAKYFPNGIIKFAPTKVKATSKEFDLQSYLDFNSSITPFVDSNSATQYWLNDFGKKYYLTNIKKPIEVEILNYLKGLSTLEWVEINDFLQYKYDDTSCDFIRAALVNLEQSGNITVQGNTHKRMCDMVSINSNPINIQASLSNWPVLVKLNSMKESIDQKYSGNAHVKQIADYSLTINAPFSGNINTGTISGYQNNETYDQSDLDKSVNEDKNELVRIKKKKIAWEPILKIIAAILAIVYGILKFTGIV